LGPRIKNITNRLRRRHDDEERGAELIEFAIVVVLLITLLYGIVTYGLILSAQATITQAAADAARSGIVTASTAVATAEAQACTDVGWMNKTCGTPTTFNTALCTFSPNSADVVTAFACTENCPSNAANSCLKVTVTYNYSSAPLFPELPGLNVITPSTISSTNVLQISTPTGS
jgi:Flp pilus assembly protein TadG